MKTSSSNDSGSNKGNTSEYGTITTTNRRYGNIGVTKSTELLRDAMAVTPELNIYKFIMDKTKKDGSIFKDRAFSNVYTCIFEGNDTEFDYDEFEVSGIVKINAKETLELLKNDFDDEMFELLKSNLVEIKKDIEELELLQQNFLN